MRKSVLKNDSGFDPDCSGIKVFLQNKEVKHCITADEELGEVLVYKLNSKNELYVEFGTDYVATEILKGNVRILEEN